MSKTSAFVKVIEAITAPLGFFVLALLIVEVFLATVLVNAQLPDASKVTGMWMGVVLFILVTGAVFALVWYKPKHLTFDKEAHLVEGGKISFGSNQEEVDPAGLADAPASTEEGGVA